MPEMLKFYPGEYYDREKELVEEGLGIASGRSISGCPSAQ